MQLSGYWLCLGIKYTLGQLHFRPHSTPGTNIGFMKLQPCPIPKWLRGFRKKAWLSKVKRKIMSTQLPEKKIWGKKVEKEIICILLCYDDRTKWVFVWMNQVFLKEGTLMKLSRKDMQPRVFFLVSGCVCSWWSPGRHNFLIKGDICTLAHANSSFSGIFNWLMLLCISSIGNKDA